MPPLSVDRRFSAFPISFKLETEPVRRVRDWRNDPSTRFVEHQIDEQQDRLLSKAFHRDVSKTGWSNAKGIPQNHAISESGALYLRHCRRGLGHSRTRVRFLRPGALHTRLSAFFRIYPRSVFEDQYQLSELRAGRLGQATFSRFGNLYPLEDDPLSKE